MTVLCILPELTTTPIRFRGAFVAVASASSGDCKFSPVVGTGDEISADILVDGVSVAPFLAGCSTAFIGGRVEFAVFEVSVCRHRAVRHACMAGRGATSLLMGVTRLFVRFMANDETVCSTCPVVVSCMCKMKLDFAIGVRKRFADHART